MQAKEFREKIGWVDLAAWIIGIILLIALA